MSINDRSKLTPKSEGSKHKSLNKNQKKNQTLNKTTQIQILIIIIKNIEEDPNKIQLLTKKTKQTKNLMHNKFQSLLY